MIIFIRRATVHGKICKHILTSFISMWFCTVFALWTSIKLETSGKIPRWEPVLHLNFCITECGILQTILKNKHSLCSAFCTFMNHWIFFPSVWAAAPWCSPNACTNQKMQWSIQRELCSSAMWAQIGGLKNTSIYNIMERKNISATGPGVSLCRSAVESCYGISKWRHTHFTSHLLSIHE